LVKFKLILTLLLVLTGFTNRGAESITLAWEASPDPEVVSYRIYMDNYRIINVGNNLISEITQLKPGFTHIFYVVAVNSSGVESEPSNVVFYRVFGGLEFEQRIKTRNIQPQNATIRGGFKLSN
jgi:hypothetical protein